MIGYSRNQGFSLIEVMITVFIIGVGLLGLSGLQARALTAEVDALSRAQALIMLNDMAERLVVNRPEATKGSSSAYNAVNGGTAVLFGVGAATSTDCPTPSGSDEAKRAQTDLCEWSNALKGTAESASGIGAMAGARGCVEFVAGTASDYQVTVVWQGRSNFGAAPTLTCASSVTSLTNRRAVGRLVRVPDLV